MAATTRESNLFAAENWNKVYETFREVDLQSYDFQTIRRSMINYLRTYYPEDFNDYIESSEYIALIDLISYLGQNLSFRADLNARENFLETAERRDSVLRLAKMLNYYPKRAQIARGLIKVQTVTTTEVVFDSNGFNLQDTEIFWGDTTNANALEQFTTVLNAAMVKSQRFGDPSLSTSISNIKIEEYNLNIVPNSVPIYEYSSIVSGRDFPFEIVKGTYSGTNFLYEVPPAPTNNTNIIYRNDGRGFSSVNTGFFFYFKQGNLQTIDFTINEKLPNRVVEVDVNGIDNNDVWLYQLDSSGRETEQWVKVPAISGNNVIFNSLNQNQKKLFSVNSRANDQISLVFGDGVFSDMPTGNYRAYFRTGNGFTYKISPAEMANVEIAIPYVSKAGQLETLTCRLSLENTIANASARENINDVKEKAQQQYYTQNRMITGEDYNILPLTTYNNILKAKAVNRTASGISRYLDVRDSTGKYSSTNIFGSDGILYSESPLNSSTFGFITNSDIENSLSKLVDPIMQNQESKQFYYDSYPYITASNLSSTWSLATTTSGTATGYFKNSLGNPAAVDFYAGNNLKYVKKSSMIKFTAPAGKVFDINNNLITGSSGDLDTKDYVWASVVSIVDDGTNNGVGNLDDGTGPVVLSEKIPNTAIVDSIIPPWNSLLVNPLRQEVISAISQYKTFGLRYDVDTQAWVIISANNLNQADTFSLDNAGNTDSGQLDNSWFFKFTNDGSTYTVTNRSKSYIFESVLETRFYFDPDQKIFDPRTGKTIRDKVKILKINNIPDGTDSLGLDYNVNVDAVVIEEDGFILRERVKVTFADDDNDSVADDPDFFDRIVAPDVNVNSKIVFYKKYLDKEGYTRYQPVDNTSIEQTYTTLSDVQTSLNLFEPGTVFYTNTTKKFYVSSITSANVKIVTESTDYITKVGRSKISFQYTHNAPNNRRIDPSPSNIVDVFLLTNQYDTDYRNWVTDVTGKINKPARPTTTELRDSFGGLESYKSISDSIIFHSTRYRPLFGSRADSELQASFKVVKNTATLVSDNEIKARVIAAINQYFAVENWDFGDTFFFSELDAYLHQTLAPDVLSITIVPKLSTSAFGSLLQIQSQRDEIFISAATVNDIDIVDVLTSTVLTASGTVVNEASETFVTESSSSNGGTTTISSATNANTNNTTTFGGYSY